VDETRRAIEAVWRIEAPRLIAGLARMVRDIGLAEEFAQDALVAALERWPSEGTPDNPGAWLMATAKHRAIDELRRRARHDRKHEEIAQMIEDTQPVQDLEAAIDDDVGDDLMSRLHGVSSGPVARGARRAHPANAMQSDDGGDRASLSGPRADDRSTDRPRKTDARGRLRSVRASTG
jgi:predicted RNA polymerase sigma factor